MRRRDTSSRASRRLDMAIGPEKTGKNRWKTDEEKHDIWGYPVTQD